MPLLELGAALREDDLLLGLSELAGKVLVPVEVFFVGAKPARIVGAYILLTLIVLLVLVLAPASTPTTASASASSPWLVGYARCLLFGALVSTSTSASLSAMSLVEGICIEGVACSNLSWLITGCMSVLLFVSRLDVA